MTRFVLYASIAVATILAVVYQREKVGALYFFLGAAILLSMLAIRGLRYAGGKLSKGRTPKTNYLAMLGALLGVLLGGFVGATTSFGNLAFPLLFRHLRGNEYSTLYGCVCGAIVGGFVLAVVGGILQMLIARPKQAAVVGDSERSSPNSMPGSAPIS
ncbi:MAG: hypothetical protein EXS05_04065 [Planctomycetaceae bacterium]|nr:hypothetical protein [Planctomycetaceae bacterium]